MLSLEDPSRLITFSMTIPEDESSAKHLIAIVGPCGSGKSALAAGLQRHGYQTHPIAQEHSYVSDMWQRLSHPHLLIFLQASHLVGASRRNMNWTEAEWQEQQHRLSHAREHADFYLDTDPLSIEQVLLEVLAFLHGQE